MVFSGSSHCIRPTAGANSPGKYRQIEEAIAFKSTIKNSDVENIYDDNEWVIDKIGDKIRISYFKDFHFVDELFLTKENFLKYAEDN